MNVKRYFGRTNKEAMSRLRAELGDDAVVLKNQSVPGGVEILAMADDAAVTAASDAARAHGQDRVREPMREMVREPNREQARDVGRAHDRAPAREPLHEPVREMPDRQGAAEGGTETPEMSTLSFQQYVRDRLAQRLAAAPTMGDVLGEQRSVTGHASESVAPQAPRFDGPSAGATASMPIAATSMPTSAPVSLTAALPAMSMPATQSSAPFAAQVPVLQSDAPLPVHRPAIHAMTPMTATPAAPQAEVLSELREMRSFIAEQLNAMAWFDGVRRNPAQSALLRRMMSAGFSPGLARLIVSRIPADCAEDQASNFMTRALAHNLPCDTDNDLLDRGGIFALVGPTGVGKTTSTAKIAARFALKHGSQSVGLVTVDAYRIGGQDQLRSYGRMLGVPVHVAHDAATLADFLHLYMNKKLVLIDTAGVAQRDERVDELLASLSSSVVRKLVVLNAASQAETIDEVVGAYRAGQAAGVVLSKVDEAVKLGGALDCVIRHRLKLVGVANGQRVPEDWIAPDPAALVAAAFAARSAPTFDIEERELALVFQPDARRTAASGAGATHA